MRLRVRTGTKPIGPARMQQTESSNSDALSDVGTLAAMLPRTKGSLERGCCVAALELHWICYRESRVHAAP